MTDKKIFMLSVVGPTASGKTALAVNLAESFGGEVISCDSMQIYKGMDIATAKPTAQELSRIRHHLVGVLEPEHSLSVYEYCDMARAAADDIVSRGKLPVICGGTGLYYNSFIDNIVFPDVGGDGEVRKRLEERAQSEGGEALLCELERTDTQCAARLSAQDTKRIIRALEIFETTGVTMSEHIRRSRLEPSPYEVCALGLDYRSRQTLYDRIDRRVSTMEEAGLVDEAREFLSRENSKTSAQAIGYKELMPYFEEKCSLEEALDSLRQSTRRYAKRQLSWFRRDKRITWLFPDDYTSEKELFAAAGDIARKARRRFEETGTI